MLNVLRKSVGSWAGVSILALALGALVITLFQPQGPTGGGASGPVLARVGKRAVDETQYRAMIDRAVAQERQANPQITLPDFLRLGGGEIVLKQMIEGEAVSVFADTHGMRVSRRLIDGEIASIPALQVNGKFDEATFRRLLAEQRISEAELRDGIANDVLRRQLLQPLALGSHVPTGIAEPFSKLLLEVRRGEILAIPSAQMPDPGQPDDKTLQAWYQQNRQTYTIPERRAFRYAILETAALADQAKPTAAEVQAYYKDNPAEFGGVERRQVNQLVIQDEAAARALVAKVRSGTSFQQAAETEGWAADDIALGEVTRDQLGSQTSPDVAAAAFSLAKNTVSDPVSSPLGYHILEITEIVPPAPQSFDSVAASIQNKLAEERLTDLMAETIARAEDGLAEGKSLADVASELGLSLQSAPPTTADGRVFSDTYMVTRHEQPELLSHVFEAEPDDGGHVADLGAERHMLFEVTDQIQPMLVPLESIRDDVAAAWTISRRSDAAKALAEKIAADSAKGTRLGSAASVNKLQQPQELSVRRLELSQMVQQGQEVPPPVLMLVNTPVGEARVIPAPNGQGWFVVKVDSTEAGDEALVPQLTAAARASLQAEAADELVGTFLNAIEREAGVVRDPGALRAVNRRMAGAQ